MVGKLTRDTFKERLEYMITTLRSEIVTGKYPVGDFLPSELAIGKRFQLSKNSVRKGLDELVKEGLIVKKSRVGTVVSSNVSSTCTTLRVGYYPSLVKEVNLFELVEAFKKKYPSIGVQLVALPYEKYAQVVVDYIENDMIDVITINHQHFVEMGTDIEKLELMERDESIYSFLNAPFSQLGGQLVQPLTFSPVILCYNRSIFAQHQIGEPDSSWQWEKVTKIAEDLEKRTNGELFGFYFHPMSVNRWPIFLMQSEISKKMADYFDQTSLLRAFEVGKIIFNERKVGMNLLSDSDSDAERLFKDEKVAMIMATYFSLNHFKDGDLDYDIAPLPYSDEAKTLLLIIGLAINKQSRNRHAARVFINYLKGEEVQRRIYNETLSIPVLKKVAEEEDREDMSLFHRPRRYHLFREIIPTYRLFNDLELSTQQMGQFKDRLRLYWSGLIRGEEFYHQIYRSAMHREEVDHVESSGYRKGS
ncbi:extracellular solute-binding protein [Pseudalkalibacillus sp. SCS-8]|uniref:extracellular solute-binding protein n=1 Tax=Pseudalkalibacillus nanhaiensis TaxID=3115291 RepID=UPI0032DAA50D